MGCKFKLIWYEPVARKPATLIALFQAFGGRLSCSELFPKLLCSHFAAASSGASHLKAGIACSTGDLPVGVLAFRNVHQKARRGGRNFCKYTQPQFGTAMVKCKSQ